MRIRLGLLVACMLFLMPSSRAQDGETTLPPDSSASPRAVNDPQPVDPGSSNDRRKNRYISFKPNNIMGVTAKLQVTLTASFPHPGTVGTSWWAQPPVPPGSPLLPAGECVAFLGSQAMAADIDWVAAGCTVLHVTGCPIEPTSDYQVRAVAGAEVSNPIAVSTILQPTSGAFWGDVGQYNGSDYSPPDGRVKIEDVVTIIQTWLGGSVVAPDGRVAHLSVADLAAGNNNLVVNYNDLYQVVLAMGVAPYPYGPADLDGRCSEDPVLDGQDAEIRFVPIRTAPLGSPVGTVGDPVSATFNGELGCWEVLVLPGVEVDLDLQAFGWGTAEGSPSLGAIQAAVQSVGYSNGVGGDLNPKGWPGTPNNGAYQAQSWCSPGSGGDGSPCDPTNPIPFGNCSAGLCAPNPAWIMPACATDLPFIATPTEDYGWAVAALKNGDCIIDEGFVYTMGGLILEVPHDAAGTYLIELNPDPNYSFMTSAEGVGISATLTPTCITIIPPCCLPDGSCTQISLEECATGGGIQGCDCRGDDDMNGVDDGCEADCDDDGILDIVELADCTPGDLFCNDCNFNCVPDDCEADADGDDVPDACDVCPGGDDKVDTDADGTPDDCDPCPIDNPDDTDGDGVCESVDVCPGGDDTIHSDGDGVPDDCDNCPDISNPGQEDRNDDGTGDACSGACCFVLNGNFSCVDTTEAECAMLPGVTGVFQGLGTVCPTEGVGIQIHLGTVVTHVTQPAQLCGGGARGTCNPGDPIDPWQTALDADICHQFGVGPESPPIPADFFGPGSDPFTGQVCLEGDPLGLTPFGEFGDADTLVQRTGGPAGTGDPFDRCDLASASEVTVNAEVVALSLQSVAPIIVTFNGGQNPESWNVMVDLSEVTPSPGTITAVKTHCNGGTYNSELHVQPRFTFTEVDDPNNSEVLDTGLAGIPFVTLTQADDPHWTSDVSETLGLPSPICTDFRPGIEDTEPTVDCDCNTNQVRDDCDIDDETSQDENGNGIPDECEPVSPPIPAPPPHHILKNRYISIDPRGASGDNPPSHHIRVMVVSSLVNGQAGNGPWWANSPDAACISLVTATKPAVEPDWTGCMTAHLTGCPIIPTTTYAVAAEAVGLLSADALFDTQAKPGVKWHGDCVGTFSGTEWGEPNGQTNIDDAVAAIKTFQNPSKLPGCGAPPCNATHTSVTDVAPNLVPARNNKIVSIEDVLIIILGFHGQEYPGPELTQCP